MAIGWASSQRLGTVYDLLNKTSAKRDSQNKPTQLKCKITLKAESRNSCSKRERVIGKQSSQSKGLKYRVGVMGRGSVRSLHIVLHTVKKTGNVFMDMHITKKQVTLLFGF